MFKYSLTQWIYGDEDLEKSLIRLRKYSYDGVELAGEPDLIDIKKTKVLLEQYQIKCSSICGIYNENRDLSSSNVEVRTNAINYVKKCIDMAKSLGARVVIVVPTAVGKLSPESKNDWNIAVRSLKELGEYASDQHITLALEAINRYETFLVNNLNLAKRFVEDVNCDNVKIMADLFHMNLEERNMVDSLRAIANDLVHVHIADNTREAAGLGQTNFAPIMSFLKNLNYDGYVSMEFLPTVSNPYDVTDHQSQSELLDEYTHQAIEHIRNIVKNI